MDGNETDTPTHKVDCFRNRIALEIEWNNKDPFYDRDLNNFRLLFDLRAISVGVIITRCDDLQDIFNEAGKRRFIRGFNNTYEQAAASDQRRRRSGVPIIDIWDLEGDSLWRMMNERG